MKQAYTAEYYPPMPVLSVRLGYPAEKLSSERFPAIILKLLLNGPQRYAEIIEN